LTGKPFLAGALVGFFFSTIVYPSISTRCWTLRTIPRTAGVSSRTTR
jgi:hypothetical protein